MIILTYLAGLMIIVGSIFSLVAALGLLRLPDVYTRMHAATKAGTLGSGLMMIALALVADDFATASRAIAALVFFLLTAPIASHLLARAAYKVGYRLWPGSVIDEMFDQR